MPIIVDDKSRVLIQGITGNVGKEFAGRMIEDGTPLVAGVTPGKGQQKIYGIPVFNSVIEAVHDETADVSLVVVPGPFARDAVFEAVDAGIRRIVVYAEGVPVRDAVQLVRYAQLNRALVFGPNSAGVITPGKCNLSDITSKFITPGRLGIVSRSGTLACETFDGISHFGLGVSTLCCLGGDIVTGANFSDILKLFEQDPETDAVILTGEIGGQGEIRAAEIIKSMKKKVFAYIVGVSAPPGRRMGHAGAIVNEKTDTASHKLKILNDAGAQCASTLEDLIKLVGREARRN